MVLYTRCWQSGGMNTDNDTPCSAADRAAIVKAAHDRRGFIRWLAEYMGPRWDVMTPAGQDLIRAEARLVLEQMVEGCS